MTDGSGLPPLYPSLQNTSYLQSNLSELPCIIKNGKESKIVQNVVMPAHKLSDTDMSNLINYLNHKWGTKKDIPINKIKLNIDKCE